MLIRIENPTLEGGDDASSWQPVRRALRYWRGGHTKQRWLCHLGWIPKDRTRRLPGTVAVRRRHGLYEACNVNRWWLEEVNRLPDHARGLSQVPPTAPVADVVQRLKGGTSSLLRNECPALEANLWGGGCGAAGAVAETSGAQSYAAVKRDMREHADRLPHQVRSRGL